jgi:hypothetical protein
MPIRKITPLISLEVFKKLDGKDQQRLLDKLQPHPNERANRLILGDGPERIAFLISFGLQTDEEVASYIKSTGLLDDEDDYPKEPPTPFVMNFSDQLKTSIDVVNNLWPEFILPIFKVAAEYKFSKMMHDFQKRNK